MNLQKLIPACLMALMALAAGCSKDDNDNYIAGYSSPGKFRPKGVAWEKSYNFGDPSISKSCYSKTDTSTPGIPEYPGRCGAVHVTWYSSTTLSEGLPIEGIAANDRHLLPNPINFTIKITRNIDLSWKITVALGGVRYTNNTRDIELIKYTSALPTTPAFVDTINGENLAASESFLNIIFVRFTSDINLYTDPEHKNVCGTDPVNPDPPCSRIITIRQTGDMPDYTQAARVTLVDNTNPYQPVYSITYNLPTGDYMIVGDHGI